MACRTLERQSLARKGVQNEQKILFQLTIVAVAFALVLGLGTLNAATAVSAERGDGYAVPAGEVNLLGIDGAGNSVGAIHRESDFRTHEFAPDSYGLWGKSQL